MWGLLSASFNWQALYQAVAALSCVRLTAHMHAYKGPIAEDFTTKSLLLCSLSC